MSGISKNIRKITEAWGGKTTGSGIGDAVMDLYNSLPFGVKTEFVEILPEQSVTSSGIHETLHEEMHATSVFGNQLLEVGKEYSVVINGKKTKVTAIDDGAIHADGEDFFILNNSDTDVIESQLGVAWAKSYGETITLAIYEEKEVVEKIDPKFVGKAVLYGVGTDENPYLYHDETLSQKVEKSELLSMIGNVLIYADFSGNGLNYKYYVPTAYDYRREYGTVCVYGDNGIGDRYFSTSEYEVIGPM